MMEIMDRLAAQIPTPILVGSGSTGFLSAWFLFPQHPVETMAIVVTSYISANSIDIGLPIGVCMKQLAIFQIWLLR